VAALAATLDVSTDYLLTGSGELPQEQAVRQAVARAEAAFDARGAA
jgi:ribosomal protein S9